MIRYLTLSILLLTLLSCRSNSSPEKFLKQELMFTQLHTGLKSVEFKTIDSTSIEILPDSIKSIIESLKLLRVEKDHYGTYYITGKSYLGHDGYLYSDLPRDSLEYFTLSKIKGNWYYWYQD